VFEVWESTTRNPNQADQPRILHILKNNLFPPLQSQIKFTQEENRLASKKQYTQIVTRGRRGEVRIAKNSGLSIVFS
jgi:hypothetical protein